MQHKPRGFLCDAQRSPEFVAADTVLTIGNRPHGDKPLVQAERGILEDGADFVAELRGDLSDPDTAAMVATEFPVGPLDLPHVIVADFQIREVADGGEQALWYFHFSPLLSQLGIAGVLPSVEFIFTGSTESLAFMEFFAFDATTIANPLGGKFRHSLPVLFVACRASFRATFDAANYALPFGDFPKAAFPHVFVTIEHSSLGDFQIQHTENVLQFVRSHGLRPVEIAAHMIFADQPTGELCDRIGGKPELGGAGDNRFLYLVSGHWSPESSPPPSSGRDQAKWFQQAGLMGYWDQKYGISFASGWFLASTSRGVRRSVSRDHLAIAKATTKLNCCRIKIRTSHRLTRIIRPAVSIGRVPAIDGDILAVEFSAANPVRNYDFFGGVHVISFRPTTGRFGVAFIATEIIIRSHRSVVKKISGIIFDNPQDSSLGMVSYVCRYQTYGWGIGRCLGRLNRLEHEAAVEFDNKNELRK